MLCWAPSFCRRNPHPCLQDPSTPNTPHTPPPPTKKTAAAHDRSLLAAHACCAMRGTKQGHGACDPCCGVLCCVVRRAVLCLRGARQAGHARAVHLWGWLATVLRINLRLLIIRLAAHLHTQQATTPDIYTDCLSTSKPHTTADHCLKLRPHLQQCVDLTHVTLLCRLDGVLQQVLARHKLGADRRLQHLALLCWVRRHRVRNA